MQRERVLANGGLLDVHLGACQEVVVDFMFAALAAAREMQPEMFAALLLSLPVSTEHLGSSHTV